MKRPCIEPGCPNLTNTTRCPTHARQHQQARDLQRGTAAERGYDHDWRKARLDALERDGWVCVWCGQPANTVDHLVPLAHGGARLDPTNLAASCGRCNSARGGKTRRQP